MAVSETHDVGRLYVHAMRVPRGGPVLELGTTHEVEEPWRVGRCVVLRLWKVALVAGWWGRERDLEEVRAAEAGDAGAEDAEMLAVPARSVSPEQIREDFRAEPSSAALPEGWKVV